jgi:hypothetical protein
MAGNRVKALGRQFYTFPSNGAALSGAPGRVGDLMGVALMDQDTNSGCTMDFEGVYALVVAGLNDAGNSAVAVGDPIFYVDGDTPKLSKKATAGRFFGTAVGPANGMLIGAAAPANLVAAGNTTTTIAVRLSGSPANEGGNNLIGIGSGTGSEIILTAAGTAAAANVTVANMTAADEIVYVGSMTTAASIATWADRTGEYVAGAGVMTKAAGTNETNNLLFIVWRRHH